MTEKIYVTKEKKQETEQLHLSVARIHAGTGIFLLAVNAGHGLPYSGTLQNVFTMETELFRSLDEAVLRMDRMMDQLQSPQSDTERRSFDPNTEKKRQLERETRHRKWLEGKQECKYPSQYPYDAVQKRFNYPKSAEVFHIRVQYRQHSSWQGEVFWKRGKKEQYFRSVLELVHLIYSALPAGTALKAGKPDNWQGYENLKTV